MQTYLLLGFGCLAALLSTTAQAQEAFLDASPLAQVSGPVDRGAAGNGSMGIGEGIDYNSGARDDHEKAQQQDDTLSPPPERTGPDHGDNDTDMEHRRRPTLGDDTGD